jgi:SAM-dependent methyltransferase
MPSRLDLWARTWPAMNGLASRLKRRLIPAKMASDASPTPPTGDNAVEQYWTDHNVTLHRTYPSAEASLADFHWRNAQYFGYIALMPVSGADGLTVLDFGCGPGHDLVGFATQSRPQRLIGMDISRSSLAEAKARLVLHGVRTELHHLDAANPRLPIPDASVDLVHSSGVLHHTPIMDSILAELRRVLKPGGQARFMVYHADSLWMHLYVAYERQIVQGIDSNLDLAEAFQKSTDGPGCPISRCFTQSQFDKRASATGFRLESFGVAVSAWEMTLLPKRFAAIMDPRLPATSRDFLAGLRFDEHGLPLARRGVHAGVDGCYRFTAI